MNSNLRKYLLKGGHGMMRRFHEAKLAETMAEVVGFQGKTVFDSNKPDGTPRKLLDVSLLRQLGRKASTSLREGLEQTYRWFVSHLDQARQGYIPAAI